MASCMTSAPPPSTRRRSTCWNVSGWCWPMLGMGLICPTWQFRDRATGPVADLRLPSVCSKDDTGHPYRLQCEQWRLTPGCCATGWRKKPGWWISSMMLPARPRCGRPPIPSVPPDHHAPGRQHGRPDRRLPGRRRRRPQRGPQIGGHRLRRDDHPGDLPDPLHPLRLPCRRFRNRSNIAYILRPRGMVRSARRTVAAAAVLAAAGPTQPPTPEERMMSPRPGCSSACRACCRPGKPYELRPTAPPTGCMNASPRVLRRRARAAGGRCGACEQPARRHGTFNGAANHQAPNLACAGCCGMAAASRSRPLGPVRTPAAEGGARYRAAGPAAQPADAEPARSGGTGRLP